MYATSLPDRNRAMRDRATALFDRWWFFGKLAALWATLTHSSNHLLFLSDLGVKPTSVQRLERTPIDLDAVRGTEGRNDRFDKHFYPVHRRDRNRWVGVATAIMDDITQVPPIDVIQVGDVYYISDGHHRVSAAKALGKIAIDANITRWHTA